MENKIPKIGFGTWRLKNDDNTSKLIKEAIDAGYRLIDTASAYGNEEAIGNGIRMSNINRNELFISGKLWNEDRGYDNIINACKKSIANLKCDYLDLYLIHWPASKAVHDDWIEINNETWKAFEYLYQKGYVKAIGVCNFKKNQLEELLKSCVVKPLVNQIEYHIGFTQDETVTYCKENNILIEAWSPLGSGKMLKIDSLKEIADKYNASTAQLCIKWCIQNDTIPLPKSKTVERIKENYNLNFFTISNEDMETLNNMPYLGGSGLDSETIELFG